MQLLCTRCQETKQERDFGYHPGNKKRNYRQSWCRPCSNKHRKEKYAENPTSHRIYNRARFRSYEILRQLHPRDFENIFRRELKRAHQEELRESA